MIAPKDYKISPIGLEPLQGLEIGEKLLWKKKKHISWVYPTRSHFLVLSPKLKKKKSLGDFFFLFLAAMCPYFNPARFLRTYNYLQVVSKWPEKNEPSLFIFIKNKGGGEVSGR